MAPCSNCWLMSELLDAFSIFVGILAARRLTTPLQILTESSRAIARGDFSQRVHLKSRTEIGELAQTFNSMTDDLERFVHDLKRAAEENKTLFLNSIMICCRHGVIPCIFGEVVPQGVIGDGVLHIHIVRRNPVERVKAPVHQVAHVCPPVIGIHDDADQVMMVARNGHHLDKIGLPIVSCFSAIYTRIPPEKLIFVDEKAL